MGRFSNFLDKIPFKKKSTNSDMVSEQYDNMERQHDKAMELIEHGISEEAIKALNQIADIGVMEDRYQHYGCEALKILGEVYETGKYKQIKVKVDRELSIKYYERYIKLVEDGDLLYKLGLLMLDIQNFSKAITYLEKATTYDVKQAYMRLGDIYEQGLNRIDERGQKSDFVVPIDIEKAKSWYQKLADKGDEKAKAAVERIEYNETHADSIEFEEKDKIYSEISEKRKAKGIEFRYKAQDAAKLQYQYTYIHDQVEGYIHKLPKDWVKSIDVDTDEEYYAPSHTYTDFAIYVTYTTVPKESERKVDDFLYYQNEAYDCDLNITPYITEYANGISARFYHKDMDRGIVTFVFKQKNRWACLRFVCSTMDIMEQYNEIIFEVANSFAFVIPTLLSDKSANRTEIQYYNEAVYYYNMEDYDKAMKNATIAIQNGSSKASYLLIELYFDEDSPYRDISKTINYAKQLFDANKDPDLAFLIGNIYDQHLKNYIEAKSWYESADRLGHKRVSFYLGRFYYYGLMDGKRDGEKALSYLKKALENGIFEAEPYIRDIENLGEPKQLQATVEMWERAVKEGIADTAFKVAMNKKEQVFYLASDNEIEQAFLVAINLGNVQAAYEYGAYCQMKEKEEGYNGPIKSLDYFYRAYESGYEDFSKEYLYQVIEHKISNGVSEDEKLRLYYDVAKKGSIPAIKQILGLVSSLDTSLKELYEGLKDIVKQGDVEALTAMHMIEEKFKELLNPVESNSNKVIQNKFFRLQVPKSCTAVINDEGGTIRFADSVVEFAVAEMPVKVDDEEEYNKVFNLIYKEYAGEENAEILVANSRMVGSGMLTRKAGNNRYSILLISTKNQYLFKLSSIDRRELMRFKEQALEIALTLVESGEIYVATGEKAGKNIGLTLLISGSSDNSMLSISKDDDDEGLVFM
ncbi:MAG: sel1 repeat family protein [Lachnospiraceae bacterium]|nr:sel1 repeat family protein [Lachnospiraceae bacterium]